MKVLYFILLWTWCLPQSLLGFGVYLFYSRKIKRSTFFSRKDGGKVYLVPANATMSGCSLGYFVFLKAFHKDDIFNHEYGHVKQSYILGWFYLLVVGIPSLTNNLLSRKWIKDGMSEEEKTKKYFSRYPEKWADKLGGVKR